jgi:hypothetical protein
MFRRNHLIHLMASISIFFVFLFWAHSIHISTFARTDTEFKDRHIPLISFWLTYLHIPGHLSPMHGLDLLPELLFSGKIGSLFERLWLVVIKQNACEWVSIGIKKTAWCLIFICACSWMYFVNVFTDTSWLQAIMFAQIMLLATTPYMCSWVSLRSM